MRIGVLRETAPHEHRVSLVPLTVKRLTAAGHEILLESGAGDGASFPDPAYTGAGARVASNREEVLRESGVVLTVQRPWADDLAAMSPGSIARFCERSPCWKSFSKS